jgi:hypothetical protein
MATHLIFKKTLPAPTSHNNTSLLLVKKNTMHMSILEWNLWFALCMYLIILDVGSAVVISPPVATEVKVQTEVDAEFYDTQQAILHHTKMNSPTNKDMLSQGHSSHQGKELEKPKRKSSLNKIHFGVWDTTDDQNEIECRDKCALRYIPIQEQAEHEICSTQHDGDELTPESCAMGVDAGFLTACKAWCNPELPTRKIHRFDKLFAFIDKYSRLRQDRLDTCNGAMGSRIVIQRVDRLVERQPVQTAACNFGFRSAFVSLIVSQQRLIGIDKLNLPIVFWEHPIMGNKNRHRYSYWWGGTDVKVRADEECTQMYRDRPERWDSNYLIFSLTLETYTATPPRPFPHTFSLSLFLFLYFNDRFF